MPEYLGNAPYFRARLMVQLIVRKTKEQLAAGFYKLGPVQ
jgi:hypothetical protein